MLKFRGQSKLLLKPSSTEQVSKILKYCNDNKYVSYLGRQFLFYYHRNEERMGAVNTNYLLNWLHLTKTGWQLCLREETLVLLEAEYPSLMRLFFLLPT